MNSLPVRLFHATLLGIILGALLATMIHGIQMRFQGPPEQERIVEIDKDTQVPSAPVASPGTPTPGDADFDHDGLTAAEELAAATDSFGNWDVATFNLANLPENLDFSAGPAIRVIDVNSVGVAVLRVKVSDPVTMESRVTSWIFNWTSTLQPIAQSYTGYDVEVFDINDLGVAVGRMVSKTDGSIKGFIWQGDSVSDLVTPDRSATAVAKRINNRGNWVGFEWHDEGGWTPVAVIDGNVWRNHIDESSGESENALFDDLAVVEMMGITENDQVLAAYGDYWNMNYSLAVAWKGYVEAAGFPAPNLDSPTPWMYHEAVINNWGEFAAARMHEETCYYFDGVPHDVSGNQVHGATDNGMVVTAWGGNVESQGVFLWSDGVEVSLDAASALGFSGRSAAISSNGIIVAADGFSTSMQVARLDQDQDADGMSDDWETAHGLDPLDGADAVGDTDNDGINNYGEYLLRSNPNAAPVLDPNGNEIDIRPGIDTDGDGIPNLWEWQNGLNHLDPADAAMDFDRDGYSNLKEYQLGTDFRGAPSYKIVELGPFDGTSYVNGGKAVLGNGSQVSATPFWAGQNIVESVILPATPNAGTGGTGSGRPAAWSYDRNTQSGTFSYYANHGPAASIWVAASPSGAALAYSGSSPKIFHYWPGPAAAVVNLSGAATVSGGIGHDISSISLVSFSPSGNFAVGYRSRASSPSISEWIRWDFTNAPVVLPLSGFTLSTASKLSVNDLGHVAGNATLSGKAVGVFWKFGATAAQTKALVLPYLSGGFSAYVVGLSNAESPWIAGMANTKPQFTSFNHATVWKADTSGTMPTAIAGDLGTFSGGNFSTVSSISPQGSITGTGNVLSDSSLKEQVFFCKPAFDPQTGMISGMLVPQGSPGSSCLIEHLNNDGEILGRFRETSSAPYVVTLWRHGKAYPVNSYITASSGYSLQSVNSLNASGTMLATAWKGEYSRKVLLIPDRDADGDGFTDAFENSFSFNAFLPNNPSLDSDNDGLSDIEEMRNGTSPRDPDSDDDGITDGWEVSWGLLPLVSSDATLDPDGDRVNNLREFQIGTNPTGLYKLEVLPLGSNKGFHSAADDGSVITQQIGANEWTPNNTFDYIGAPDSSGLRSIIGLQPGSYMSVGEEEWWYEEAFWPSYHNAGDGTVNAIAWDYSDSWEESEGTTSNWNFTMSMSDCTDSMGEWIDQTDVAAGLAADGRLGEEGEALFRGYYPDYFVSPSGTIRVMYDPHSGTNIEVDHHGRFIGYLPDGDWQRINNEGVAIRTQTKRIYPAGAPSYNVMEVYVSGQEYPIALPAEWFPSSFQPYILSFSDDGLALFSRRYMDPYGTTITTFWVLDTHTGICSPIRTPGLGIESIARTSDRTGRIVGNGPKPFQITQDGSCIRLEALRIRTSPTATPVSFGSLYTKTITPNHISSDGRITLTTLNSSNQTIILQIVPDNDVDADGLSDDWEKNVYETVWKNYGGTGAEFLRIKAIFDQGLFNGASDLDGDGRSASEEFKRGTNDADAKDSFGVDDRFEENYDDIYITSYLRNAHWNAWNKKDGFDPYVVPGEQVPVDPDQGGDTGSVVEKPIYYLKETSATNPNNSKSYGTTSYSEHSETIIEWDISTQSKKTTKRLSGGSWSMNGQSGSWTMDHLSGNPQQGDSPPGGAGEPPLYINDPSGYRDPWGVTLTETNAVQSPTHKTSSSSGSWESAFWQGRQGSWSNSFSVTLSDPFDTDLLVEAVDEEIESEIEQDTSEDGSSNVDHLHSLASAVEAWRTLNADETDFSAWVADYLMVASYDNARLNDKGLKSIGWYETSKNQDDEWKCSFVTKAFEPNLEVDPAENLAKYEGTLTRLAAEGNNQRKEICTVDANLSVNVPLLLEINGQSDDQGGSEIPDSNDPQLQPLSVNLALGTTMLNRVRKAKADEFESDVVITQFGGDGKIRFYKRIVPADPADPDLEELTLPLRLSRTDPSLNDLIVEGIEAGLVKLGVSFTSKSGMRLSAVRSMRVAPHVEKTTMVRVNDADHDGDGIPAYADGFIDKFNAPEDKNAKLSAENPYDEFFRFGDEVYHHATVNFYIDEWSDTSIFTDDATITFEYAASDPAAMILGDPDETGSRVSLPTGKLRLWSAYGTGGRTVKDIDTGGRFVKSGTAYNYHTYGTQYVVEALEASTAVNDLQVKVTIDPDGSSGPEPSKEKIFGITAFGMSLHEVLPDNTMKRRLTAPLSYPAPRIDEKSYLDVRNLRYDGTEETVRGDLMFPFSVRSDALNLIENDQVIDPKVYFCINGEPQKDADGKPLAIQLVKSATASSVTNLRMPFDRRWEGKLQTGGVPLSVGNNSIELLAVDQVHGFRGSLKYHFEVQAIPGPTSEPDDDDFVGYGFNSPQTSGQDILKIGGGDFRPYTFRIDAPVEILQTAGSLSAVQSSSLELYDPAQVTMPLSKHGPSYFMGARSGWGGPVVLVDIPKMVKTRDLTNTPQTPAEPDPFKDLDPESDAELGSLKTARAVLDVNRDGDVNADDVMADLKRLSEQHLHDRLDLSFYAGFAKGFAGNPKDALTDTIGIGVKVGHSAAAWALEHPKEAAFYICVPLAAQARLGQEIGVAVHAGGQRAWDWYNQNAPQMQKLAEFLYKLTSSGEDEVFEYLLTGNLPGDGGGLDEIPEEWRVVIDAIAIVYATARDHWLGMSPADRGYVFGYISFEVAATAVGTVVTAVSGGAAAPVLGAKIASTLRLVYSILGKLKKASKLAGPIDDILGALNPVVRRMCTAGCFAAGTLIATSSGLLAIEQIEPGMEVWAWDALANKARLCKVEETFSNAPLPVWRMDYDLDGDQISDGHLVATKDHPIWAENAGRYMPFSELKEGDRLRQLENDQFAEVISVRREPVNQATFNMRVRGVHNYFAGEEAILTHNTFCKNIDSWSDGVRKLITESQRKWDELRLIPGYKHWGDLWQKSSNGDLSRYTGNQAAKLQALFNDELDDFVVRGTINGRKSTPIDCPGIPGLKEPENRMVEKIRKYHHEQTPRSEDSPGLGWVKANPLEHITSKIGPDGKPLMDFEKFDCLVDEVKSEIFHPMLDGNLTNRIYDKIQDCKSTTKNAKRLYVELEGLDPSARDQLIQAVVDRRDGRIDLREIELYFATGNTFIEKVYGK